MKILILYHSSNQVVLMDSLCKNINNIGLYADSFDTSLLRFFSPKGKKKSFCIWLYRLIRKIPRGKGIIERLFFNRLILHLAEDYDIIDIQSLFKSMYSYLVPRFKAKGKKVKVHIWGSDFYKNLPEWVRWQVQVYDNADIIQIATEQMRLDFVNRFPQYKDKIRIGVFGNQHLDDLIDFKKHPERTDFSFLTEDCQGKIIITCGYNARPRHQHIKIIEALNKLPNDIRNKIIALFPMTYLRDKDYLKQVENELENAHFRYVIINNYLTEDQLMSLRMMTDLYINIIESDALSSSTQEHLFCGNVVLVGDWLPYAIFEENGLFYLKTSLTQLYDNVYYAITNLNELKIKSEKNSERLYNLTSWKSAIVSFKNIYEDLDKT